MVGLLFCSSVVNYIDRVNISVAAPVMMKETGWDKDSFGLVFSAFLVGYTLLQIPGGITADRWSARKMLALSFCGFSLFTALTPLGQNTLALLLLIRFLVGACESVTFPSLTSLNSRWIPRPEFGRAQTLSISGITVGQMVAYPLTTWIVLKYSWQTVFYVNAVLGIIWAAIWMWYSTDTPQEHPAISQEERSYIEANLAPKPSETLPLRFVFTSPPVLILCISYMCFAYIGWMFLFWFPTYLVEARGFSLAAMGVLGVLLHGVGFVAIISGGAISDRLLRQGWSPRMARTRFAGLCVGLSVPFLIGAAFVPSATLCVVFLMLFYLTFASAIVGYSATPVEFNPHLAGAIFGMINCVGSFAGIFGPMTAGFIVAQTADWTLPFALAAAFGVACSAILFVVPVRPITFATFAPAVAVESS
jgi:sugar phosphate permease